MITLEMLQKESEKFAECAREERQGRAKAFCRSQLQAALRVAQTSEKRELKFSLTSCDGFAQEVFEELESKGFDKSHYSISDNVVTLYW